jgi:small-conductance mechanosensitive channel
MMSVVATRFTRDRRRSLGAAVFYLVWLASLFAGAEAPAFAQDPGTAGVPVRLEGVELFRIRTDFGPFTAEDRARATEERIYDLTFNPFRPVAAYELRELPTRIDVVYGDQTITTVTPEEAGAEGVPPRRLAEQRLEVLRREVEQRRATLWNPRRFLLGLLYTALFTVALLVALRVLLKRLGRSIAALESDAPLGGRFAVLAPAERLSGLQPRRMLARSLRAARLALVLAAIVLYIPVVLSFFPRTSFFTSALVGHLLTVLATVWAGLVGYLPKLVFVVVIAVLVYYGIRLLKLFFDGVKRGAVSLPNFDPEWAEPTYKIGAFLLVALAVVTAFPYLPGSQSEAFKGVSLFIGLVISLASSSAISNVIAGVILTYTGAFRIGDRVKIADTVGDVVAKTLLVTRVRTVKKVDIAIPNSLVLGSHIVNYSSEARSTGLILNTSVTIGYDAPWRRVHELLIAAALETRDILPDPRPFVFQTSLNDFYVSYELNAHTRNPWQMAAIYSELHSKIQDKFNEAGVEIMSPHYSALRDGNQTAVPEQYLPATYRAPAFHFEPVRRKAMVRPGGDGA